MHLHLVVGVITGLLATAVPSASSISGLGNDIKNAITAASGALAGIALGGGALALAYHALARNFDSDPSKVAHHNASMKKVVIGTAIAVAAGGLVAAVSHYFT